MPPKLPEIRQATVAEIIPVRYAILRAGLPISESHFEKDNDPDTLHAGAFIGTKCAGAATFVHNPFDGQDAYQLRGMAVDPQYRSQGVGKALLDFLIAQLRTRGVKLVWCNARLIAIPFYERLGWTRIDELFEIPTAGPHYRMWMRLA